MMAPGEAAFPAPAKVNLFLHVGAPRPDGRHPLDSLVVFADGHAADRLKVAPADRLSLEVSGPFASETGPVTENLVYRAAEALKTRLGRRDGARLTLDKALPAAAGIGGGSADAAAALRGLGALWSAPQSALEDVAPGLGGDVPACLANRPVLMRGDGDRVVVPAHPVADMPALLVNPRLACPTGPVFRHFDTMGTAHDFRHLDMPECETPGALIDWLLDKTRNDLEAPAIACVGGIGAALERLNALERVGLARMSGSGATCFALFETREAALVARDRLARDTPDWWVRAVQLGVGAAA